MSQYKDEKSLSKEQAAQWAGNLYEDKANFVLIVNEPVSHNARYHLRLVNLRYMNMGNMPTQDIMSFFTKQGGKNGMKYVGNLSEDLAPTFVEVEE